MFLSYSMELGSVLVRVNFTNKFTGLINDNDPTRKPNCSIIEAAPIMNKTRYTCKLRPRILFIDLAGVEHHYKYEDPGLHRSEALRFASRMYATVSLGEEAA